MLFTITITVTNNNNDDDDDDDDTLNCTCHSFVLSFVHLFSIKNIHHVRKKESTVFSAYRADYAEQIVDS